MCLSAALWVIRVCEQVCKKALPARCTGTCGWTLHISIQPGSLGACPRAHGPPRRCSVICSRSSRGPAQLASQVLRRWHTDTQRAELLVSQLRVHQARSSCLICRSTARLSVASQQPDHQGHLHTCAASQSPTESRLSTAERLLHLLQVLGRAGPRWTCQTLQTHPGEVQGLRAGQV